MLVGCRDRVTVIEEEARTLFEGVDVASVVWLEQVIVGGYDGLLYFEQDPEHPIDTGGRAAVAMLPLSGDELLLLTESGRVRVLHVPSKSFRVELPSGADNVALLPSGAIRWVRQNRYVDYRLPSCLLYTSDAADE